MASNNEQFYKRLKTLSGIVPVNESKNETNTKTLIDFERANNGTVYGVVKENHQYLIKKALVTEGDVKVTDFSYIDGVENKGKYQYNSLAEAEKQRNFYLRGINEAWDQGGVYFVNETSETETPSLETKEDFHSLVKRTITEGKKNITEGREKKFKDTLPENVKKTTERIGLMPEAANEAVKKALGIVTEEAIVTADSEIKDGDIMPDKKGKESPQAPINDSNAKSKAEKATATGKKDANKKPDSSKSMAVNQADKVLKEEASPLVTDDSEINVSDSVADKVNQKHEAPQAPINDSNAKAEADKATGSGSASAAIQNNTDDNENAGDETGDIVTEGKDESEPFDDKAKLNTSGDIVATDSDEKDADRVDNETKHENPDADYNNYNQPEKGQKEEKGEALKDTAKEKVIGEAESLIIKDSEIKAADALADMTKTNLPKKTGKSEIVADSDMNPKDTLANKTTTNLPDTIAEGIDDDDDADNAELADIEAAAGGAQAAAKADMSEADEAGEEIDAAASALDDLDIATDAEEAAPEMGGDPAIGGEAGAEMGGDPAMDAEAEEGNSENLAVAEIEKLVGKVTEKIRTTDLEPKTAEGFLKSVVSSFKDKLPEIDLDAREEVAKDIKQPEEMGGDPAMDAEVVPEMGGDPAMDAIEEPAMEEDAPIEINGEPKLDDTIPDGEGVESTFETYMGSRGYSKDNLEECSDSEMGSIMSGYATENGEGLGESDYQEIGKYMNDNVATELTEYGHGDFADRVKPFMEGEGMSFGMTEPTLPALEMEEESEEMAGDIENAIEDIESAEIGTEPVVSIGEPADEPIDAAPVMGFANDSEVMGAGMARPDNGLAPKTKSVEVDINAGTLKLEVTEGEDRVRKYVKDKLNELAGKGKMNINESKKSDNLKKLDKLIEQQWKMLGESVKKSV